MSTDTEIFHVMKTMRAMRRLKRDPVPDHVLAQVLEAGTCAPSGQNLQRWSFLVVEDDAGKQFFGERYAYWMRERFADVLRGIDYDSAAGRQAKAAMHLADHMHEAPVLLFCCGTRDWPFAVAPAQRVGRAPPSYGSIYPAVQNILLACRALGLGASLTTMHQMFEDDMHAFYGIPETHGVVAVIPIGYPAGKFGPITREPAAHKTHFNRWGQGKPGLAAPTAA